jgi:hypothetical protein
MHAGGNKAGEQRLAVRQEKREQIIELLQSEFAAARRHQMI